MSDKTNEKIIYSDSFSRFRHKWFLGLSNDEKIKILKESLDDLDNCHCNKTLFKCHHDLLTDEAKIGIKKNIENQLKDLSKQ